jgi:hypothetical protein
VLRTLAATTLVATILSLAAPLVPPTYAGSTGALSAASLAGSTGVRGHWQGRVSNDAGSDQGYRVRVRIFRRDGVLKGRVHYVGNCRGHWTYVRTRSGRKVFRERITHDPGRPTCLPHVTVKVHRIHHRLKVVWISHQDRASMLAHRLAG